MGETRRDGVDEKAYLEAERKWQEWQAWESSQARKKKGKTESSEEERAIRREKTEIPYVATTKQNSAENKP